MHSVQLILVASTLAGLALAHSHDGNTSPHERHSNSITGKFSSAFLTKRQDSHSDGLPDGIPAQCTSICTTYLEVTNKCYDISPEVVAADDPSGAKVEDNILKCVCTADFFQATQACLDCMPSSQSTVAGVQQMVDEAAGQCAASGYPVEGVRSPSASDAPTEEIEDTPASSSVADLPASTEASSSAIPSDTSVSRAVPQSSSSAAPTGAASSRYAQNVLALAVGIVPAAIAAVFLL